jgi:Asp/Glu/hydantoin racemase
LNQPTTIACLHTSHVLIPVFTAACGKEWPGVDQFHMVDESLLKTTMRLGELTKGTIRRVVNMIQCAREGGADVVVVTCSTLGPAVTLARPLFDFPVIRVDDGMAEEAVRMGRRIGVAATARTTMAPTVALLRSKAKEAEREVDVVESLSEDAFEAVLAGDTERHDRLVCEALERLRSSTDVVVLAQATMARVLLHLPAEGAPVLASPERAVRQARSMLSGQV